jgi:hypothetical protein
MGTNRLVNPFKRLQRVLRLASRNNDSVEASISVETPIPEVTERAPAPPFAPGESGKDPYRPAILVLLALSAFGATAAFFAAELFGNPVLSDVAITLGLSSGALIGVVVAQTKRKRLTARPEQLPNQEFANGTESETRVPSPSAVSKIRLRLKALAGRLWRAPKIETILAVIRAVTAVAGSIAIFLAVPRKALLIPTLMMPWAHQALWIAALCLAAAGLAAAAARYLADIPSSRFPEAAGLCRGARVVAWILALAGASIGLAWAQQYTIHQVLHLVIPAVDAAVCYGLLTARRRREEVSVVFPLDLGVFSVLGSRASGAFSIPRSNSLVLICAPPGRLRSCDAAWSRWPSACASSAGSQHL